jgi:hypothetical protein
MSCCSNVLSDDDKLTELPCCGKVMHSTCAFKLIGDAVWSGDSVTCPFCFEFLWGKPPINTPVFNGDKDAKPIVQKFKKAVDTFEKYARAQKNEFKTLVLPHIDAIKGFQRDTKAQILATNEYKELRRNCKSIHTMIKELKIKYDIPASTIYRHYNLSGMYLTPIDRIRRFLRIKA